MQRVNFTQYDEVPKSMISYMRHYGPHFNKKLCDFAVGRMKRNGTRIVPYGRADVERMLKAHNVEVDNDQLYDSTYVANMCKADFLGSSVIDEGRLAKYVKDVIDDEDAYDGIVFNRWYADMCYIGIAIDWEAML